MFKLKIPISYVSNASKYTENSKIQNVRYTTIYPKRFIHKCLHPSPPPPHKNHLEKQFLTLVAPVEEEERDRSRRETDH